MAADRSRNLMDAAHQLSADGIGLHVMTATSASGAEIARPETLGPASIAFGEPHDILERYRWPPAMSGADRASLMRSIDNHFSLWARIARWWKS